VKLFREQGLYRVYRAWPLVAAKEGLGQSMLFGSYFMIKHETNAGLAGMLAGVCYWSCVYPLDTMKTRMMADFQGRYSSCRAVFREVWQLSLVEMHRGFGVVALRSGPVSFCGFYTYEYVRSGCRQMIVTE
jgi:hypothetical protein